MDFKFISLIKLTNSREMLWNKATPHPRIIPNVQRDPPFSRQCAKYKWPGNHREKSELLLSQLGRQLRQVWEQLSRPGGYIRREQFRGSAAQGKFSYCP